MLVFCFALSCVAEAVPELQQPSTALREDTGVSTAAAAAAAASDVSAGAATAFLPGTAPVSPGALCCGIAAACPDAATEAGAFRVTLSKVSCRRVDSICVVLTSCTSVDDTMRYTVPAAATGRILVTEQLDVVCTKHSNKEHQKTHTAIF